MTDEIKKRELIRLALAMRKQSYCPYSGYAVGAALLEKEGGVFCGCNVENASYGAGNCAERTAVYKAVSEGCRSFEGIAIAGAPKEVGENIPSHIPYAFPCGICRQVLREFCDPARFFVIVARSESDYEEYRLEELLPQSFGPENL